MRAVAPEPMSPWWVVSGLVAVAALVVVGQVLGPTDEPAGPIALTSAIAASCIVMGLMVLFAVPRHVVGRLLVAAGAFAALSVAGASWASVTPLAWLSQWTWWPPYGLIALALLLFPDGRPPGRRWAALAVAIPVATATVAVALAIAALDHPTTLLVDTSEPISARAQAFVFVAAGGMVLTLLCMVGVLVSLIVRWRRADGDTRRQLACLLPAAVIFVLALIAGPFVGDAAAVIVGVAIPAGMMLAILRYRLYNLDTIINRTLVWLVMTLLVVGAFVAVVAMIRQSVTWMSTGRYESLVATGVVAVAFEPVRRQVQRGVNRLLYGERDDPYLVIARLGQVLGRSAAADALPRLTATIARSLQVPYVAVTTDQGDDPTPLAEAGRPGTPMEAFPMTVHGRQVGRLLVATRNPNGRFTRRERRLFTDLALHAAVAVETARLIRDLRLSRERLVKAREEERRRLRRDLHDGVGPALTGISLQVRAVQRLVTGNQRARAQLVTLLSDLDVCGSELRQVVDQLRPPALDGGLEGALRVELTRYQSDRLAVDVSAAGDLTDLPAAIEVAAWRIVAEAVTNVTRHANASACQVTVRRDDDGLYLEILDDGVGIDAEVVAARARKGGLGIESFHSRADELGGHCVVEKVDPTGTAVRVWLPVAVPEQPQIPRQQRSDDLVATEENGSP
ncbi:sensor histidine kinase [Virgisporangium aurantiacum]|uniref:histidine kinase n=1 Tax=Virgisporangium aurantiacum TaxID=175570 RepID=A0A8J3ZGE9_9ACTN|nr:histidine kinase [Virgisporangium aurantiacum]GIJ63647.1 hypothetical protein Vau01_111630 [Virgisporangium aurantiacum]